MASALLLKRARNRRLIPTRCGAYPPTSTSCRLHRRPGHSVDRTLSSSTIAARAIEGEPGSVLITRSMKNCGAVACCQTLVPDPCHALLNTCEAGNSDLRHP